MAKPKMKLTSNFRAAKGAGHDALSELVRDATDAMHDTSQARMGKAVSQRGYKLNPSDIEKETGDMDGKIEYGPWYGRFFEYGTVHIQAMPFMGPGHRAGRKVIRDRGKAKRIFEKWFRKKAVR